MKRRDFVRAGSGMAMAAALPRGSAQALLGGDFRTDTLGHPETLQGPGTLTTLYDPQIRAMAIRAVESAQRAGAQYADVRCTNIISRGCPNAAAAAVQQSVAVNLSVRSLVKGYWGWSGTNILTLPEAARVGAMSAQLATEEATLGRPRTVDLGTIPIVTNQTWETPVETDPFTLKLTEVYDWLLGVATHLTDRGYEVTVGGQFGSNNFGAGFTREERLFASSEGSLTTQTIKTIAPAFGVKYRGATLAIPGFNREVQGGWEKIARSSTDALYALVEQAREAAEHQPRFSGKPADIGRYDIVYSAAAMATILGSTLVPATELDRALGYEANETGTSYLGPDPMNFLGSPVASPVVTVTAERSTPDALATVKWDDEGVAPQPFTLVKDGVLVDYQTTREQAAWLASWYHKQGRPVQSHGCAGAPSAGFVTMQHTPNIGLAPSATSADEDELIAQMGTGLFVPRILVDMDFQHSNGMGVIPGALEIRNGKRVAVVSFPRGMLGTLIRSTDLWKNIVAVGGEESAVWFTGAQSLKGEPGRSTPYCIRAVPALVKGQAIVDPLRKA